MKTIIPKYIKDKMHKIAKLNAQANKLTDEVDDYLRKKGYDIDYLINAKGDNGRSLEELNYGNDITDKFIEDLENGFYEE